ncbi:endoribonuclease YbeY-like isoform X2 [Gordionus sp. m RMFG-2023]|uniref:endoribonuclease YbeY-like isoform X2 n=1 Tax=Gordionus sp. m RMFG-2023 TaxID=3053472 RepID=UPI0031FD19ED
MTLLLKNLQKIVQINLKDISYDINKIRKIIGVSHLNLAVLCVDNDYIKYLNKTYRNDDRITDVISFPQLENLVNYPIVNNDECLGDIFLALPYIQERAKSNFNKEIQILVIHGICHLIGFNHTDDKSHEEMVEISMSKDVFII